MHNKKLSAGEPYTGAGQKFPTGEEKPTYRGNKIPVSEAPEEESPEIYDGPMGTYKVIGEIFPLNPDGSSQETPLEMNSIHELPKAVGDQMVEEGTMEEVLPTVERSDLPEKARRNRLQKVFHQVSEMFAGSNDE